MKYEIQHLYYAFKASVDLVWRIAAHRYSGWFKSLENELADNLQQLQPDRHFTMPPFSVPPAIACRAYQHNRGKPVIVQQEAAEEKFDHELQVEIQSFVWELPFEKETPAVRKTTVEIDSEPGLPEWLGF